MKDFLFAILFSTLLLFACSSEKQDAGISGRYIGTQIFGFGQISSAVVIQVRQQGSTLTGTITPPFRQDTVNIMNGNVNGASFQFDTLQGGFTFHYSGVVQNNQMQGNFEPIGCIASGSQEPCPTDSNGSFNASKQ